MKALKCQLCSPCKPTKCDRHHQPGWCIARLRIIGPPCGGLQTKEKYDENARGDYCHCVGFIAGGKSCPGCHYCRHRQPVDRFLAGAVDRSRPASNHNQTRQHERYPNDVGEQMSYWKGLLPYSCLLNNSLLRSGWCHPDRFSDACWM